MIRFIMWMSLLVLSLSAGAEDLGVKNQTIAPERDAREVMKDVVRKKEASGEIDRFWKDYTKKTIDAIKHPEPLGIASRYEPSTELVEPRFVIPQDYRDEKGQIVVKKGTVIEPLKISPLTNGLIFIDGRDQRQVEYAIAAGKKEPLKIVLTAGSYVDLRVKYQHEQWNGGQTIPFYFDQKKMIITNLDRLYHIQINRVPAKITQVGTNLQIQFGILK